MVGVSLKMANVFYGRPLSRTFVVQLHYVKFGQCTYVGMLRSKFDSSVENIGKRSIVVVVNILRYTILYIHQVPALRGFRITRTFSGTKMRVTRGLGIVR